MRSDPIKHDPEAGKSLEAAISNLRSLREKITSPNKILEQIDPRAYSNQKLLLTPTQFNQLVLEMFQMLTVVIDAYLENLESNSPDASIVDYFSKSQILNSVAPNMAHLANFDNHAIQLFRNVYLRVESVRILASYINLHKAPSRIMETIYEFIKTEYANKPQILDGISDNLDLEKVLLQLNGYFISEDKERFRELVEQSITSLDNPYVKDIVTSVLTAINDAFLSPLKDALLLATEGFVLELFANIIISMTACFTTLILKYQQEES
jgi:hypothetical protein